MSEKPSLHDPLADVFESFRGDTLPSIAAPGADAVRGTVRRRRRNRAVAVAACAAVVLVGAGIAAANVSRPADGLQPADPPSTRRSATPSASESTTPSAMPSSGAPAVDLQTVNWRDGTVPIPAAPGCPGGQVVFHDGVGAVGGATYTVGAPAYGDVTGDGRRDALIPVECRVIDAVSAHLVVVSMSGTRLRAVGAITLEYGVDLEAWRAIAGDVVATVRHAATDRTQTRRYRWDGSRFTQIGGPSSFPGAPPPAVTAANYDWRNTPLDLPFAGASVTVQPNDQSCPRLQVVFSDGSASASGCAYRINVATEPRDLDGDDKPDVVLEISAGRTLRNSWLFAYTIRDEQPRLLGFVTAGMLANRDPGQAYDVEFPGATATTGQLTILQFMLDGGTRRTVTRTFRWTGGRFTPDQPAPDTRVDTRP